MPRIQALFRRLLLLSLLGIATTAWAQASQARTGQFFRPLSPALAAAAKSTNAPGVGSEAIPVLVGDASALGAKTDTTAATHLATRAIGAIPPEPLGLVGGLPV